MSLRHTGFVVLAMTSLSLAVAACGASTSSAAGATSPTPTPTHIPTGTPVTPTPTNTATPTPTGTPLAASTCSFVWATSYVDIDGTYDFYEVDVNGAAWNNATAAFGTDAVGYFIVGWNPNDNSIYSAGMAIDGAIVLNVAGQAMGEAANFSDAGGKTFYDAYDYFTGASTTLGAVIADGGAGFFTGVLSDPDPNAPATAGGGSVDATDTAGFSETFGGSTQYDLDYAVCTP